ncbi:MAG: alpha-L-fucosidase, partial [Chitinophagaceae bacterium]|nr:alpha-L-fucosidase [Chitinophagaceae bacterium]
AQLIQPFGPLPTKQQMNWHEMEFYLFMHFGPNTFSGLEWGHGTEDPNSFNPTQLDCRQWARIARDAGAKGIIITAKHHDGFSLWPSKFSKHTVRESKWRNGKGDVLKELSAACKEFGLKFGIYISPWDRNHPKYGTPAYNTVYVKTMREAVKKYGPIFEMWWDGANGEGPNGKKQVYTFPRFEKTIRKIAPDAVVFSDIGPDVRWVGNERGIAGETNWNLLDTAGFQRGLGAPHVDTLNMGNANGKNWIPAECDVSIRPGWFYHKKEDSAVKSGKELMSLYLKSVGRGANFLLNVPPDTRGLIHENDSASLMAFKLLRDGFQKVNFALRSKVTVSAERAGYLKESLVDGTRISYWAPPDSSTSCWIEIEMTSAQTFNTIVLEEYVELGQRVAAFEIHVELDGKFVPVANGTTIGKKRIIQFQPQKSSRIKIEIKESKAAAVISEISVFLAG